jgi:hypothetical protein
MNKPFLVRFNLIDLSNNNKHKNFSKSQKAQIERVLAVICLLEEKRKKKKKKKLIVL